MTRSTPDHNVAISRASHVTPNTAWRDAVGWSPSPTSDAVVGVGGGDTARGTVVSGGGVEIYDSGMVIKDKFGTSALDSGGFSGNWLDFLADGLYNSVFRSGVVGPIANGSLTAIPAWMPIPGATYVTMVGVADTSWPGGYYVEGSLSGSDGMEMQSNLVPVMSGSFVLHGIFGWIVSGGSSILGFVGVNFFAADGVTLVGTAGATVTYSDVSLPGPNVYHSGSFMTPLGARFAVVLLTLYETGTHSALTRLRIGGGGITRSVVGTQGAVYPDGVSSLSPFANAWPMAVNQSFVVPITVTAPADVGGCSVLGTATSGAQSFEWRLFYAGSSSVAQEVPGMNGSYSWTATGRVIRNAPAVAPMVLMPGAYWLAIRNTHVVTSLYLACQYSGLGSVITGIKNASGVLGPTFDFDTLTSQDTSMVAAWLTGWSLNQPWG